MGDDNYDDDAKAIQNWHDIFDSGNFTSKISSSDEEIEPLNVSVKKPVKKRIFAAPDNRPKINLETLNSKLDLVLRRISMIEEKTDLISSEMTSYSNIINRGLTITPNNTSNVLNNPNIANPVSDSTDTKVSEESEIVEEDTKVAEVEDTKVAKVAKEEDTKVAEEEDTKVAKEEDTKEEDTKVAEESEIVEEDTKVSEESEIIVEDTKVSEEENTNVFEIIDEDTNEVEIVERESVPEDVKENSSELSGDMKEEDTKEEAKEDAKENAKEDDTLIDNKRIESNSSIIEEKNVEPVVEPDITSFVPFYNKENYACEDNYTVLTGNNVDIKIMLLGDSKDIVLYPFAMQVLNREYQYWAYPFEIITLNNITMGVIYFNLIIDKNGIYTMIPETDYYETNNNDKIDFSSLDKPLYLRYNGILE